MLTNLIDGLRVHMGVRILSLVKNPLGVSIGWQVKLIRLFILDFYRIQPNVATDEQNAPPDVRAVRQTGSD